MSITLSIPEEQVSPLQHIVWRIDNVASINAKPRGDLVRVSISTRYEPVIKEKLVSGGFMHPEKWEPKTDSNLITLSIWLSNRSKERDFPKLVKKFSNAELVKKVKSTDDDKNYFVTFKLNKRSAQKEIIDQLTAIGVRPSIVK